MELNVLEGIVNENNFKSLAYVGESSDSLYFNLANFATYIPIQLSVTGSDISGITNRAVENDNFFIIDKHDPVFVSDVLTNVEAISFILNVWMVLGRNSSLASQTMDLYFDKACQHLGINSQLYFMYETGPSMGMMNVTSVHAQAHKPPKLKVEN